MTAGDLRDLIARDLIKAHGGSTARWRRAIGEVKVYPRSTHAHCNWELRPAGPSNIVEHVERAADAIRASRPFIDQR
jgi:hypothetical protein